VQLLRPLAVIFVLATTGAGAGPKVPDAAECPGRCDTRIGYDVDPAFSEAERAILSEGMAAWEQGSGGRVCFQPGGHDVEFIRLEHQADLAPQDTDWAHHVALTKGNRIWLVPSKVDERGEYVALVIHELGHRLGLPHIEDSRDTYMHSTINDTPRELWQKAEIPARDRREFCAVRMCACAW
jgi:hypothetical protein